jgi:hypothetical protein
MLVTVISHTTLADLFFCIYLPIPHHVKIFWLNLSWFFFKSRFDLYLINSDYSRTKHSYFQLPQEQPTDFATRKHMRSCPKLEICEYLWRRYNRSRHLPKNIVMSWVIKCCYNLFCTEWQNAVGCIPALLHRSSFPVLTSAATFVTEFCGIQPLWSLKTRGI